MEVLVVISKALLLMTLVLTTCGDPLVGEDYRGEPLFRFSGQIGFYDSSSKTEYNPRLSIFWSKTGDTQVDIDELIEQPSASVNVSFPAEFEVLVFSPPEKKHMVNDAYGLALILIYNDVDKNGWFNPQNEGEMIIGGSPDRILLYAPSRIDAAQSPVSIALPKGFSVLWLPVQCEPDDRVNGDGTSSCSHQIGAACSVDEDCGEGGVCLLELQNEIYPNGYCSRREDDSACVASSSTVNAYENLTMRGCVEDEDCPREGETCYRTEDMQYDQCNVCWPSAISPPQFLSCFRMGMGSEENCPDESGHACSSDADCEFDELDGKCKQTILGTRYPDGICDYENAFFSGCVPSSMITVEMSASLYFKDCASNDDCREEEGYICDGLVRACIPEQPIYLELTGDIRIKRLMLPLCASGWNDGYGYPYLGS